MPEEEESWKNPIKSGNIIDSSYYGGNLIPRFSAIPRGSRLMKERVKTLKIGDALTPEERALLMEVLFNQEKAIAFEFEETGVVKPEVEPPYRILTIKYTAWQASSFRVPKGLRSEVKEIIDDRLKVRTVERYWGPYRNPWFLVEKKNKKHRLILAAQ